MRPGSEAGDGANFALSKSDRRALLQIRRRGRRGATAKEIGHRRIEDAGLAIGARLMRLGLVVVTPSNRFVLKKYKDEIKRSGPFVADDNGRTGMLNLRRAPLPRHSQLKPPPVDTAGIEIKKLSPGEAVGARDLQRKFR